jgi:transposase
MSFNNPMAAYSLDLRKRIVDAVERGLASKRDIARTFSVHETFVHKLLRQKRQRGDLAPLPHGGGATAILNQDHLMTLTELVADSPDATLAQLREQLRKKARVEASISTIWRALDALGLSRKKSRGAMTRPTRRSGPPSRRNR